MDLLPASFSFTFSKVFLSLVKDSLEKNLCSGLVLIVTRIIIVKLSNIYTNVVIRTLIISGNAIEYIFLFASMPYRKAILVISIRLLLYKSIFNMCYYPPRCHGNGACYKYSFWNYLQKLLKKFSYSYIFLKILTWHFICQITVNYWL